MGIFKVKAPKALHGKSIAEAAIRQETGCTVIILKRKDATIINPAPGEQISAETEIMLIGTAESEDRFLRQYHPMGNN